VNHRPLKTAMVSRWLARALLVASALAASPPGGATPYYNLGAFVQLSCAGGTTNFSYTGGTQSFVVPTGCSHATVTSTALAAA